MNKKRVSLVCCCLWLFLIIGVAADSSVELLIEKADELFAEDYIEGSLRASIGLYEQALLIEPDNPYLLNRLSRAYYELAYVHLYVLAEDPGPVEKERNNYYEKGMDYGMRSLELNPQFVSQQRQNFEQALQNIDDVAALHWTSCNWGKLLEAAGISISVPLQLPKLRAMFERAIEVDRAYLYGGPLRAMASYLAGLPWWLGQDLKQAKVLFEESIKLFPDFLGNRALYVQEYLARKKDCQPLKEQVVFIRQAKIHDSHIIWDMAAKIGIEKFLETIDWCLV